MVSPSRNVTAPRADAAAKGAAGGLALDRLDRSALVELARRVADIDGTYRQAAERMGQLYMYADSVRAHELTRRLDEPMRNASRNELMLRALLDELQACVQRPPAAMRETRVRRRRGNP